MLWKNQSSLEGINALAANSMLAHLGIEFTEIGDDYLIARMPVDHRTHQPLGLLHGGASVALAESMGSFASVLMLDDFTKEQPVGVSINANHLNAVRSGYVYGKVTPVKVGRTIHVWQINIQDEEQRPVCSSRLTVMVVGRK